MQRARIVAFSSDGPRTALHKMEKEGFSSIFVVDADYTWCGVVRDETALEAVKRGDEDLSAVTEKGVVPVLPSAPVRDLFALLAGASMPGPVVDDAGKLLGVVVKASLLQGLAEDLGGKVWTAIQRNEAGSVVEVA